LFGADCGGLLELGLYRRHLHISHVLGAFHLRRHLHHPRVDLISIITPVLDRPANAEPLLRSLERSTATPWSLIFVCSPGDLDEQFECRRMSRLFENVAVGVVPWEPGYADFARKTTWAISHTHDPWLFFGADDLEFTSGWDTQALHVATASGKRVIGTNDHANPLVKRGKHATHFLVARSYIEEYGVVDERGAFFSSSYDHGCVDVESVAWAQHNNEWAFAKDSVVKHKHPIWRTAPDDPTYTKANRHWREDRALWEQRKRLWR
jgi:hypothetical protein